MDISSYKKVITHIVSLEGKTHAEKYGIEIKVANKWNTIIENARLAAF